MLVLFYNFVKKPAMITSYRLINIISCSALMMLSAIAVTGQDSGLSVNRNPVVAGTFYPANKNGLKLKLEKLFSEAIPKHPEGRIQSLIVPHAGYDYSGIVAASAFKSIPADAEYSNVFIIASSHRELFDGASVYSVGNYLTPLGEARVNKQIANELIDNNKNIFYLPAAHNREHSIEVQLPFIQYHLRNSPSIIPIVMGSSSVQAARELAKALLPYFTPENLFVISSDFSHYPEYREAKRIDQLTADAIFKKDPELFYNTLRKNSREQIKNLSTPCCGWSSILSLLYMSQRRDNLTMIPLLYRNSGDSPIGDKDRVVGYWAIAGYEKHEEKGQFKLGEEDKEALLEISRKTLVTYLKSNQIAEIPESEITPMLNYKAGVFVSLYMGKRLRGCVGNFFASKPLYQLVQEMTLAAATRDHRFAPVELPELEYLNIEISVLTPLQKINRIEEFQLGKHGIYMTKEDHSGTYLPQVAENTGWDTEEFLGHCAREKAGIGWDGWKDADLYIYEAIVFGEENVR